MKLLSVISPIYNCEKTINRMLESILNQRVDKNLIEVILCDDNSTDNWRDIANSYTSLLPIRFCKTSKHEIHCPGNTRIDGLKYARGRWVTFIDDDDMFGKDAFFVAMNHMSNPKLDYISTNIDQFSPDMSKHGIIDSANRFLLHGKFYRKSFLDKHKINFKENLYTMEDVYFNSVVFSHLFLLDNYQSHMKLIDEIGYKWVINPNSLSHSYENEHDDWFIDAHLGEYIYASTAPFLEMLEKYTIKNVPNPSDFTTPLFITVMDTYFRYQSGVYQIGHELPDKNLDLISQYYHTLSEMFHLDPDGIVDTCISCPENYFNGFRSNMLSSGYFIPDEGFRPFVRRMFS